MVANENKILSQIVHKELFHGCLSKSIGLFSGKMGLSIFLYHYSQFTGNMLFADFAGELVDEVCESVYDGISLSFANGLSGIGWGLEYLAKKRFIEIDDNFIFEDIDYKILEINPDKVQDCSFAMGLEGIATYVHAHISAERIGRTLFPSAFIRSLNRRCCPKTEYMVWHDTLQRDKLNKLSWQNGLKILLMNMPIDGEHVFIK